MLTGLGKTLSGAGDYYLDQHLNDYTFFDFTTLHSYYNAHQRDMSIRRIDRYKKLWAYYTGEAFREENAKQKKFAANFVRPIVNKLCDWMTMTPWEIRAAPGNEAIEGVLEYVWQKNSMAALTWRTVNIGSVSGDGYLMVSVNTFDPVTKEPLKPAQYTLRVRWLDSAYVHPVFDPADNTMIYCVVQYPFIIDRTKENTKYSLKAGDTAIYTLVLSRNEMREFINNMELADSPKKHYFGRVPIAHIPNYMSGSSFFGVSDTEDIMDMNIEHNDIVQSMRDVVKYQGEPITLIFGARVNNLIRGQNRVWSGFPNESRVEQLRLDGDQTAAKQVADISRDIMHIMGQAPKTSMGETQQVSNLTQAGLEIQYLPLIEKLRRKHITYGNGFAQVNSLLIYFMQNYFQMDFEKMYGIESPAQLYDTTIEFGSPFPKDQQVELNQMEQRQRLGIVSSAQLLRELKLPNPRKIAAEILADKRAELLVDAERAQASAGSMPNLNAFGLSSLSLDNNLTGAFLQSDELVIRGMEVAREYREEMEQVNEAQMMQQQLEQAEADAEQAAQNAPPEPAKPSPEKTQK